MNRLFCIFFAFVLLIGCASARHDVPRYSGIGEAVAPADLEGQPDHEDERLNLERVSTLEEPADVNEPSPEEEEASKGPTISQLQLKHQITALLQQIAAQQDELSKTPVIDLGAMERHIVAPSQTLTGILSARRAFSRLAEVAEFNGLENPDMIFVGQSLWVPVGSSSGEDVVNDEPTARGGKELPRHEVGGVSDSASEPQPVSIGGKRYDSGSEALPRTVTLLTDLGPVSVPLDGSTEEEPVAAEIRDALKQSIEVVGATQEVAGKIDNRLGDIQDEIALLRSERDGARHALVDERRRFNILLLLTPFAMFFTGLIVWAILARLHRRGVKELLDTNDHFAERIKDLEESLVESKKRISDLETELSRFDHVPLPGARALVEAVERGVDEDPELAKLRAGDAQDDLTVQIDSDRTEPVRPNERFRVVPRQKTNTG